MRTPLPTGWSCCRRTSMRPITASFPWTAIRFASAWERSAAPASRQSAASLPLEANGHSPTCSIFAVAWTSAWSTAARSRHWCAPAVSTRLRPIAPHSSPRSAWRWGPPSRRSASPRRTTCSATPMRRACRPGRCRRSSPGTCARRCWKKRPRSGSTCRDICSRCMPRRSRALRAPRWRSCSLRTTACGSPASSRRRAPR